MHDVIRFKEEPASNVHALHCSLLLLRPIEAVRWTLTGGSRGECSVFWR